MKKISTSVQESFPEMRYWLIAILVLVLLLFPAIVESGDDDCVVVHARSTVSSISRPDLVNVYLKKTTKWKNGVEIDPIDLAVSNPVRVRFSQEILGRSAVAIQAHWKKQIFAGKGVPPIELVYDGDALHYVGNHPGAIGYVSATTYKDAANVKRVKVTEPEEWPY